MKKIGTVGNASKNDGNYNHFVNVFSALARLVMYFANQHNLCHLFEVREKEFSHLVFDETPSLRTFLLILAGFYHDIGKSVTDPRHAMEGAILLAYHTTSSRYDLHRIAKSHRPDHRFEREDLMYVAGLVLYHDHFGTLATGEDGYMALVNVIDRFKRYSLKHDQDKERQLEWTRRYLFDLWLLNVADIMVSMERKWQEQEEWLDEEKSKQWIGNFLTGEKGGCLVHDLKVTFHLLEGVQVKSHNTVHVKRHTDDLTRLFAAALDCAKRHAIERLQRLASNALIAPLAKIEADYRKKATPLSPQEEMHQAIVKRLSKLRDCDWQSIIIRNLQAVGDRSEFIDRLSWIGRMDYSLGFFQKLASVSLKKLAEELEGKTRTGWVRTDHDGIDDPDYYHQAQAEFFADNFVASVVSILSYVLFREPSIDRLRNIEFSDASARLTDNKIEQLLALEGPFRTRRAVEAIMQTIYFY